jgi:predicted NUDIX family NTP pyrophosphohydrolase
MPSKHSAGLLLFRGRRAAPEVLLVHPGGPFWVRRDAGAWSIPKGEYEPPERPLDAARREFAEETGIVPPDGEVIDLGEARQRGGKVVHVWALAGDVDAAHVESSVFELEWPPGSGTIRTFPEVDRAGWFDLRTAREKVVSGQLPFLDALASHLGNRVE